MPISSCLKPLIKEWLQKSIKSELEASSLYKHIANRMQKEGFFGTQSFFLKESADELEHYQEIVDYINDMGDVAEIPPIQGFNYSFVSIGEALNKAYTIEKELLYQYTDFYKICEEEDDCVTAQFILKFIERQRKAIGEFGDLISRWERVAGLAEILFFDNELSKK